MCLCVDATVVFLVGLKGSQKEPLLRRNHMLPCCPASSSTPQLLGQNGKATRRRAWFACFHAPPTKATSEAGGRPEFCSLQMSRHQGTQALNQGPRGMYMRVLSHCHAGRFLAYVGFACQLHPLPHQRRYLSDVQPRASASDAECLLTDEWGQRLQQPPASTQNES